MASMEASSTFPFFTRDEEDPSLNLDDPATKMSFAH